MAILVDRDTRVLVQGVTGTVGSFQARLMKEYGTKVVAGVTPGKGGQKVDDIPVYDLVEEALNDHQVDGAISFVPAPFALDGALELIDNHISFIVLTAEGIPDRDILAILHHAEMKGCRVLGPDTPGLISPGRSKVGVHPHRMFTEGPAGIVSKSGSLSYEVGRLLTASGIGQSTVVGIGGGPIWGITQKQVLQWFQDDPQTRVVVLIGEVGGRLEYEAAAFIGANMDKPVVALIVGRHAPTGRQMGHAGAIIEGEGGTAARKIEALQDAGAHIAATAADVPRLIRQLGVQ